MILDNPVFRLMLRVISACGLAGAQRDIAASPGSRAPCTNSPFVLVACTADGRWGVFEQNFDMPLVLFDEMQEACDYANELANARMDSMVLIGKRRDTAANRDSSVAEGSL